MFGDLGVIDTKILHFTVQKDTTLDLLSDNYNGNIVSKLTQMCNDEHIKVNEPQNICNFEIASKKQIEKAILRCCCKLTSLPCTAGTVYHYILGIV